MRIVVVLMILLACSGCGRAFWMPDWDKAETERLQYQMLERETVALEKIADSLQALAR